MIAVRDSTHLVAIQNSSNCKPNCERGGTNQPRLNLLGLTLWGYNYRRYMKVFGRSSVDFQSIFGNRTPYTPSTKVSLYLLVGLA